jgi:hypothetical protein
MKKLIISVISMISLADIGYTQDAPSNKIPKEVSQSFESSFNNASDIEWERHLDIYEVDFDLNKRDYTVWYNPEGGIVKQKNDITISELPLAVTSVLENSYRAHRVSDVQIIIEGESISYKLELDSWTNELELIIDKNGKIISQWED